ncbi:hypothetical protein pb186bvf_005909 [Paramecium bursaria]
MFGRRGYFISKLEKLIKEKRKSETQLQSLEDQDLFLRTPFAFKKYSIIFTPFLLYNLFQLEGPYFSKQFTNAVCRFSDLLVYGYSGLIGATFAYTINSKFRSKYLAPFVTFQLGCIFFLNQFMYDYKIMMLVPGTAGLMFYFHFLKIATQSEQLGRSFFHFIKLNHTVSWWILLTSLFGLLIQQQYEWDMERKIKELQRISDAKNL